VGGQLLLILRTAEPKVLQPIHRHTGQALNVVIVVYLGLIVVVIVPAAGRA
jgi:hypothetical protein